MPVKIVDYRIHVLEKKRPDQADVVSCVLIDRQKSFTSGQYRFQIRHNYLSDAKGA